MRDNQQNWYRQRIYQGYVTHREQPLAPESLAGLKPRLPYLERLVKRHIPRSLKSRILELGCGHGALLYVLRRAGYMDAWGVDGSEEQVAAAKQLGIAGVTHGDLMAALSDIADGSLDVVIAFDVIEHFLKDELILLVDEVCRVLRPGGQWIIHVPNGESPFGGRMQHWDFTHELAFTRNSLAQLLKASGFSDVHCFEDRPVPHGVKSAVRSGLWAIFRIGLLFYIAVETGSLDRNAVFSQNILAVATKSD